MTFKIFMLFGNIKDLDTSDFGRWKINQVFSCKTAWQLCNQYVTRSDSQVYLLFFILLPKVFALYIFSVNILKKDAIVREDNISL